MAMSIVVVCGLIMLPLVHCSGHSRLELPSWQPALGQYAFDITVTEPAAQKYFGVGLLLLYNFDQPNARSFFEAGLEIDPTCAMCSWGIAYSYGPFLNLPTVSTERLRAGYSAAKVASGLLAGNRAVYSKKEQALIDSMMLRYPEHPEQVSQLETYLQFSKRLQSIREDDPLGLGADADMMTFDADARMVLMCDDHGYHFYTSNGDNQPPTAANGTVEITALLKRAISATNGLHTYAQHLIIHSTEMSNAEADSAVQVARHLLEQMRPLQNAHLQHMTSHTLFRTGYYHEAVEANILAVTSDSSFLHHGLVPYGPGHDAVFLVCSAMWAGERQNAYHFAKVMQNIYKEAPGRGDGPDGSLAWSYPMLVSVRFGDWNLVEKQDVAPPGNFSTQWPYGYSVLRHFSMAVAKANLGKLSDAKVHIGQLQAQMPVVEGSKNKLWSNLTAVANLTASAVLTHAQGDIRATLELLENAVDIEMGMSYDEPPNWLLPSRECFGQALMDAGRHREAEKVFRALLYGYSFHAEPQCGWALHGLRESLRQQQQQKPTSERGQEIQKLTEQITQVWRHSDVVLVSSCLHLGTQKVPVVV